MLSNGKTHPMLKNVAASDQRYVIYLQVTKAEELLIGKLGLFSFPIGMYLYVGSAKRNIAARLKRHLAIDKPLHWHFDYLRPHGEIVKIDTFPATVSECELRQKKQQEVAGELLIKGFGSSDCKCESHLIYICS